MGKFHQFLMELSARDTIMMGYYRFMFLLFGYNIFVLLTQFYFLFQQYCYKEVVFEYKQKC